MIALAAWVSLGAQFAATSYGTPDIGWLAVAWRLLRFFTILTNLMVALTFSLAAVAAVKPGAWWGGGLTLWIGIVGVVNYALLYRPLTGLDFWADTGLHGVVPVAVFLWWAVSGDKRGLRWPVAVTWLVWPAVYVVYAQARGAVDGVYPYFFTDPGRVGWDGVVVWSLFLCLAFFLAGVVLVWLARVLPDGT
ncbi:Pr6Pr family membrane protein [Oceanicola sp. 22II-s10i]|uniref:Pr6Pr family membrane protein n=1 Tax=Oceanicola sp. 22II-s10i TaxID=1317116 RepID=UPI0020CD32C4|nr:Pr6Pr family membrane protein [Oceanicola sp. 22II-s10i]